MERQIGAPPACAAARTALNHSRQELGVVWELEFAPSLLPKVGREPAAVLAQMQAAFTHFIDLNGSAPGARRRPVAELPEAVAYLDRGFTNLLLYRA